MSTKNPTGAREARQIYRAWRFGEPTQEIAERHNRTVRSVNDIISRMNRKEDLLYKRRKHMLEGIAFPNIAKWMDEHGRTLSSLAREIGITETTLRNYLGLRNETGPMFMHKKDIDAILEITGFSYGRAFKTKEDKE